MKKGKIYEGVVQKVVFPNKGIVETEEKETAIVKNSLTGQKVSFAVNKARHKKYEGRLLEIIEKSPLELEEPYCPHFGICGGCTYQNLSYEEQLRFVGLDYNFGENKK